MSEQAIDITVRPASATDGRAQWSALAVEHWRKRAAVRTEALSTRAALGLPTNRPVVMTGHQAEWWHAGILTKALAADAVAQKCDGSTACIIVDQDDHDPGTLRVPVVRSGAGSEDQVGEVSWRLRASSSGAASLPTGRMAMFDDILSPVLESSGGSRTVPAAESVEEGVSRLVAALARARETAERGECADTPNLASQIGFSLVELATPYLRSAPSRILATRLSRLEAFGALVRRMIDDPRACIWAYNDAVARHPHAGVARLTAPQGPASPSDWDRAELPLWALETAIGSARRRVDVREARRLLMERPETLVPRALLMTGFLRLHVCDLFIHGLGGERYDPITEEWLGAWLGEELAPTTTATATLLLEMSRAPKARVVTPTDVARAKWARHRARHDPAMLAVTEPSDRSISAQKQALLSEMKELRRARRKPGAAGEAARRESARAYRALHALLEPWRESRREALRALDDRADRLQAEAQMHTLRADRTWFFAFHPEERLRALERAVRERVV